MKRIVVMASLVLMTVAHGKAQNDSIRSILNRAEQGDAVAQNEVGLWYYSGKNVEQNYTTALQWWAKAAQQGDATAIGNMGLCFEYGRGVERDSLRALGLYLRSIERGNEGLFAERVEYVKRDNGNFNRILIAQCYQRGFGTAKDLTKAMEYYEAAAKNRSTDGQRELALCLLEARKNEQAAPWFKMAADAGDDVVSAYQYGKMLKDGQGVPQDKQAAVIYWLKAAEHGYAQAQCDLGNLYYQGDGVQKDEEQAVRWFTAAAGQGYAHAQWNLAVCRMNGEGVTRDYEQALFWFGEAASQGYARTFGSLCNDAGKGWKNKPFMLYLQGMKQWRKGNLNEAAEQFRQLEKQKVTEGKVMYGVCLSDSRYGKSNPKNAVKILQAVAGESRVAQFWLATLYESGNGVKKDVNQALTLLRQAAAAGYAVAQCHLGDLYYEGRNVSQDYVEAVKCYRAADEQKQLTLNAAKRYAVCLENGLGGLTADRQKAEQVLKDKEQDNIAALMELF